jgi:sodium transport system permease protein
VIQFKALLGKELKEALRDRRALLMAFMMAIMAPVMIFALSKVMIKEAVETPDIYVQIIEEGVSDANKHDSVQIDASQKNAVQKGVSQKDVTQNDTRNTQPDQVDLDITELGLTDLDLTTSNKTKASHAPQLLAHLAKNHILPLAEAPEDKKALWKTRNFSLTIPANFNQNMLEGKTINLYMKADYSDKAMMSPIRRLQGAVREYSLSIGYKRLVMRGIDIRLLQPVMLIEQDSAVPSSNAMIISMMLGLYLLMAAFMSGLAVAIDSSAGERERNVLEMLLCQPVSTTKIVLAKLTSASLLSITGVILTLTLTTFAVSFIDLTKIGATFNLTAATITALLLLLLPICFFASAIQLFVAFQSKNFKEAQSLVSMVIMLPAIVPVLIMFIDDRPNWLKWLPISGQSLLMEDLFKGIPVSIGLLIFTGLSTLFITALLVWGMAKKLTSEKVVLALS